MSTPRTRTLCVTLIVCNSYFGVNISWYCRICLIIDCWLLINNVSKYPINMLCYNVLCFCRFNNNNSLSCIYTNLNLPSNQAFHQWTLLSSLSLYRHQIMISNVRTFNILYIPNIFMYVLPISHNITFTT